MIQKHKMVSLTYRLEVEGQVVDQTGEENPLNFLFGVGQMIAGFEKNLEGKNAGEEYSFAVSPEEGYGTRMNEDIVEIEKEIFIVDGEIIPELQLNAILHLNDEYGMAHEGKVLEIKEESVTMDFNHPLADKTLNFTGKILEVRDASPEEINAMALMDEEFEEEEEN